MTFRLSLAEESGAAKAKLISVEIVAQFPLRLHLGDIGLVTNRCGARLVSLRPPSPTKA
jgi:hypothetical protein